MIKFDTNKQGKIILVSKEGEQTLFDYAVDAREALYSKDETGEQRYFLPDFKSDNISDSKKQTQIPVSAIRKKIRKEVATIEKEE